MTRKESRRGTPVRGMPRQFIGTRAGISKETEDKPSLVIDPNRTPTLEEAFELFVNSKVSEGVRESTLNGYYDHMRYLRSFLLKDEPSKTLFIDDLSASVIREYIRYQLEEKVLHEGVKGRDYGQKGLSPTTVNIRIRTLRTMCRFWYEEGLLPEDPMRNIKRVRTDQVKEVEGLSDEVLHALLASYDETQFAQWRDKTLILLFLDTGLRPREGTGLMIDQVDLRLSTLLVPSEVAKNRSYREVPLSRPIAKRIGELYEESSYYFPDTRNVFNNAYGGPFTPASFRKRLNKRRDRLGLKKLSPNQFRHTFARNYLLNGGDVFTLQKILDHADIKTTRKYVQMDNVHVRRQHSKFTPSSRYLRN